jgi:hypothetical protein
LIRIAARSPDDVTTPDQIGVARFTFSNSGSAERRS